jgi:hypothetical protein
MKIDKKLLAGIIFMISGTLFSQGIGDGARAYFSVPVNTLNIADYGVFLKGNLSSSSPGERVEIEGDLTLNLNIFQISYAFPLFGNAHGVGIVLPAGKTSISADVNGQNFDKNFGESSGGFGDMAIYAAIGLVGSKALTFETFKDYDPGFTMGVLTRVYFPTGKYDEQSSVNLGSNRYTYQIGAPMFYYFGNSFFDEHLASIEFIPIFNFFSDNGDVEKKMLISLENHITYNIKQYLWVSVDSKYTYGAETVTAGLEDDNKQNLLGIGATIGFLPAKRTLLKLGYARQLNVGSSKGDGGFFRVSASYLFKMKKS